MDYAHFERSLTPDAAAFYKIIPHQDNQTSPSPAWKGPRFWLPSVSDLVSKPYEAKEVFHMDRKQLSPL
jgi:hypothetical protein